MDYDMGYEDMSMPSRRRRGSMSHEEEKERRASIRAVLADQTLSPASKRRSIQHLMDGRRRSSTGTSPGSSVSSSPVQSCCSSTGTVSSAEDLMMDPPPLRRTPDLSQEEEEDYGRCSSSSPCAVGTYAISNAQTKAAELNRPVCTHYDRRCTMIAPCCGAAFGCRICHDDCPALPPKINNGGQKYHRSASLPSSFTHQQTEAVVPQDTHHAIDRFAVTEVICRECFTRQGSKTNRCVRCGVQFGKYHCSTCNLWMSDEEGPYHCDECGFCRVGGGENFRHCRGCGMCIDARLYDSHSCRADKYRGNCPVCQEYLFSSRGASHEMPCGHAIHWDCFRQLAAHDSRCPVCKKTAETRERMLPTWRAMAQSVAGQPVPPELSRVVAITCNDCEKSDGCRPWHFLGIQCRSCSSFNTVVDRIVMGGEEAHEFLELHAQRTAHYEQQQESHRHREADPSRVVLPSRNPRAARRRVNRRRSLF